MTVGFSSWPFHLKCHWRLSTGPFTLAVSTIAFPPSNGAAATMLVGTAGGGGGGGGGGLSSGGVPNAACAIDSSPPSSGDCCSIGQTAIACPAALTASSAKPASTSPKSPGGERFTGGAKGPGPA